MTTNPPDSDLLLLSLVSGAALYLVIGLVTPRGSPVPVLVAVFVFSNMLSRTTFFQTLVRKTRLAIDKREWALPWIALEPIGVFTENSAFTALPKLLQLELLQAISSLEDYASNSRKTNDRRRSLFRLMSWRQQKLCDEAGYSRKLKEIDASIGKNQTVFSAIADAAKKNYGISYKDSSAMIKQKATKSTSSSNYRVVESMGHFIRDWADSKETSPLVNYIFKHLDDIIPKDEVEKTCIIVPGSGLGRVAHEIASHQKYGAVHAVEFSGLMHCCNQFVYETASKSKHVLVPYANSTSNYLTSDAQFREVEFPAAITKPSNLHLHLDDFCAFQVPEAQKYENVVIVSVFFIDTAENILDYFDQMNQLSAPSRKSKTKNGYWINVGPLKYGSAARAELNGDEIAHIRKSMGWRDIDTTNTLESPEAINNNGLLPYITDEKSLWQGFYGVTMWCTAHKDNLRKRN